MRSICNIDFNLKAAWGSSAIAHSVNQILLSIKPARNQKTNLKIEMTDKSGQIFTNNVTVQLNGLIEQVMYTSYYMTAGKFKMRLLSDEANSDYINFETLEDLETTDDIICKYRYSTQTFEVYKLEDESAGTDYSGQISAINTQIESLRATTITTDYFNAEKASIYNLIAEKATVGDLTALNAEITSLIAQKADITDLTAINASIASLTANKAEINDLHAIEATVELLNTHIANIDTALVNVAYIDDLEAINANIADIVAGQITVDYIEANFAKIDLSNIENGCITTAMIGVGVVDTAQIADAAVTDAKIVGMTANKITAGKIDAAQIEVVNLNAANITVGTINGVQIANGAIDMNKLSESLSTKITDTAEDVEQALKDAGLAQTDATQALEDALEAFNKAQEALSSANAAQTTANGKNTVFYQTGEPATAGRKVNDVWYDTDADYKMYYFNGTAWQAVEFGENAIADEVNNKISQAFENANTAITNASGASSTAASAKSIAEQVNSIINANKATWDQADDALAAANGKNTIFYQASAPATAGRKVNDVWFDTDDGNKMYYFNGTAWTVRQFGTNAIANAAITNALIADATIQSAKIAALDAAKITSGYISAARIQAGTITADRLKAGTITAASGVIANAAILTANIADLAVTNAKLANLSVTNAKIADATIQSAKIAALDAGKITTGTLSADRIAASSLAIGKLDSSTQSLINNSIKQYSYWVDLTASTYNVNTYYPVRLNTAIPNNSIFNTYQCIVMLNSGSKPSWSTHTNGFSCNLLAHVKYNGWGVTDGKGWIEENFYNYCDKMPAYIQQLSYTSKIVFYLRGGGKYCIKSPTTQTFSIYTAKTNTNTADYPQYVEPTTSPSNGYTVMTPSVIGSWCASADKTLINGGKIYTGSVTASQIAASAVTADKIATNAVIAAKISAGAVTSDKLSANSVIAGKIAANAVTTGTIAADAVTAAKIAADAILAEHVAANAITTENIVAGAVTGAKIAASTITANNIAAGTITAAKIASGTITATQIASGTITATQLASNSVTAVKIAASAVTADKIAANAVTAAKIATDAIKSRNYVANSVGSYLNLADGSFTSKNLKWDANGNLTATNGSFNGTINSTAGTIGGFSISSSGLIKTSGTFKMTLHNSASGMTISGSSGTTTVNTWTTRYTQNGISINQTASAINYDRTISLQSTGLALIDNYYNAQAIGIGEILESTTPCGNIFSENKLFINTGSDLHFQTTGNLYHNGRKMMPVYMVSGTIIKSLQSDSVIVHTISQINSMFSNAFGFTPENWTYIGMSYVNGDAAACSAHLEGTSVLGTDVYAVLSRSHSGNIRVNYAYFYCKA